MSYELSRTPDKKKVRFKKSPQRRTIIQAASAEGFPEADLNSSIALSSFRSDYYEQRISPSDKKKPYKGSIFKNMEDPREFEFIQVPLPP